MVFADTAERVSERAVEIGNRQVTDASMKVAAEENIYPGLRLGPEGQTTRVCDVGT
jgi:hypothetical protein